ncbi:MAG: T9SS type A sorting domain-containing protein [Bacteroidota bacterium]
MFRLLISSVFFFTSLIMSGQPGSFNFQMTGDSVITGSLDETLFAYAELSNDSPFQIQLLMIREVNEMPKGWGSAICTDVCQAPEVDTALQVLQPNTTQEFIMYFYTNESPNTGLTRMKFINLADPSNVFFQEFRGITSTSTSVAETQNNDNFTVGPNPLSTETTFRFSDAPNSKLAEAYLVVYSVTGNEILRIEVSGKKEVHLKRNGLPSGPYFFKVFNKTKVLHYGKLLVQ